jgi:hypothetical protein
VVLKKLTLAILAALSLSAQANITLTWTAPTTDVNGDPITAPLKYKVMYSTTQGAYNRSNAIDAGSATTYTVTHLVHGTRYYFVAYAYATGYEDSANSNETTAVEPSVADAVAIAQPILTPDPLVIAQVSSMPPVRFGSVKIGRQATKKIELVNQSKTPWTITSAQVMTGDTSTFTFITGNRIFPLTIKPGVSLPLLVTYRPGSVGFYASSLVVVSTEGTLVYPLTGAAGQ